ncbi:MAG: nucleoside deaminase [Beijerinckiaceae bacterium]
MSDAPRSELDRRAIALLALSTASVPAAPSPALSQAAGASPRAFRARAFDMKRRAIENGDQGYGAVLVADGRIIAESPSRVVSESDPTAHAEMSTIGDAARLGVSLAGAVLYSTSIPCAMCQAAASAAGVARMIYGESLIDAGAPRGR